MRGTMELQGMDLWRVENAWLASVFGTNSSIMRRFMCAGETFQSSNDIRPLEVGYEDNQGPQLPHAEG